VRNQAVKRLERSQPLLNWPWVAVSPIKAITQESPLCITQLTKEVHMKTA
jgi:hypothetical protein